MEVAFHLVDWANIAVDVATVRVPVKWSPIPRDFPEYEARRLRDRDIEEAAHLCAQHFAEIVLGYTQIAKRDEILIACGRAIENEDGAEVANVRMFFTENKS